jgi:hypothetical protein
LLLSLGGGAALLGCNCGEQLVPTDPELEVVASLAFGDAIVGSAVERFIELESTGRGALGIAGPELRGDGASAFEVGKFLTRSCTGANRYEPRDRLSPAECARAVSCFRPSARRGFEAVLAITSDDARPRGGALRRRERTGRPGVRVRRR